MRRKKCDDENGSCRELGELWDFRSGQERRAYGLVVRCFTFGVAPFVAISHVATKKGRTLSLPTVKLRSSGKMGATQRSFAFDTFQTGVVEEMWERSELNVQGKGSVDAYAG